MTVKKVLIPAIAALFLSSGAYAQQVNVDIDPGLVTVDLSNINVEIAKDLNVDVSQIPVTVQAPIDVAASVCDVAVNVLAEQADDAPATCDAKSTSAALNEIVQEQLKLQN